MDVPSPATDERQAAETTMEAAVVVAPRTVEIERIAVPQPRAGQVRVRLEGCGVCASNVTPWEGPSWATFPMAPGALGHRHLERVGHALAGQGQALHRGLAADAAEFLAHDRGILQPVAVGVDDRVGEAGVDRAGVQVAVVRHREASSARGSVVVAEEGIVLQSRVAVGSGGSWSAWSPV